MEGKKHSEETRKKCQKLNKERNIQCVIKLELKEWGSPSVRIEVKNIITDEIKIYESISQAAEARNIRQSTISSYLRRGQNSPASRLHPQGEAATLLRFLFFSFLFEINFEMLIETKIRSPGSAPFGLAQVLGLGERNKKKFYFFFIKETTILF